jgi:hypothetical protein
MFIKFKIHNNLLFQPICKNGQYKFGMFQGMQRNLINPKSTQVTKLQQIQVSMPQFEFPSQLQDQI